MTNPKLTWLKAKCPECGSEYEYALESGYKPSTCSKFECIHKHIHPALYRNNGRSRNAT